MKKRIAPQMVKVLILLSAITLGQMSLAQSDSEDESDAPCVQFENTEYKKKPGCLCLSARAPIANQEKASHQNGKIQPRFSLSILPKREMSSPRTPSSSKEKKRDKKERKRSKSLSHRSITGALSSARSLLSPTRNSPNRSSEVTQNIDSNRPRELEESLGRLHAALVIEDMIRIHPANLFTELLELERITETNLSLYVILREAINRIPSPTIPGQHNRAFLNTLVAFIHDHLKKSLVNDSLQGIAPALLVMALEEYSSNKTQANNIVWEEVFSARITDIQDEEACNETLQALRIFVLKYLIYNLQNWGDQEIGEDLLTVAHIFHIQITGHAEIDTNPHKELLAHIIATEIYMLLEYLKLPTSVSNACSSLDQARALTKNSDYTS